MLNIATLQTLPWFYHSGRKLVTLTIVT